MVSRYKQMAADLVDRIALVDGPQLEPLLDRFCHTDCVWNAFHPFLPMHGNTAAASKFWQPLKNALPDFEIRPATILAGEYEGHQHVSVLGHVMGTHADSLLGIPPTHQLTFLRFAINLVVEDDRFARAYIMFDLIDMMRQAGFYPLRTMPGSIEQWAFPPGHHGFTLASGEPAISARSLAIVREMQRGLPHASAVVDRASAAAAHSPHWAEHMNWFGPAGIGSSRGMHGFRDRHGALFLKAFPDRSGIPRDRHGPDERPGHFCEIGDARWAMTAGWPAMRGTHTGGQWLGLPPTGKAIEMRVADWYRLTPNDRIVDNWVMIDIPHILDQMGLDIIDDLRFFANPAKPRLD